MGLPTISFEHDGRTYDVRPITEFEYQHVFLLMCTVLGVDSESWDTVPLSQKTLARYFVMWHMVTQIDGEGFNLWLPSVQATFSGFAELVGANPQLAAKWSKAYNEANKEATDPNGLTATPNDANES